MNLIREMDALKTALARDLPGTDIQWQMASTDRRIKDFPRTRNSDSKLAAVLILLYPYKGNIHTLFIQRPVYNGVHSGQISFPGGKQEDSDRDLTQTALREACEETGLCKEDLSVLGLLTPLYIPVSNIEVSSVVAYCNKRPALNPCKNEVVSIIETKLSHFKNPSILKEKPMLVRDEELKVKYYDYEGHVIWGATALLTHSS